MGMRDVRMRLGFDDRSLRPPRHENDGLLHGEDDKQQRDGEQHDGSAGLQAENVRKDEPEHSRADADGARDDAGLTPAARDLKRACHGNDHHGRHHERAYGARRHRDDEGHDEHVERVDERNPHARYAHGARRRP